MGNGGTSKELTHFWRNRPKFFRVRQTLTRDIPIHAKAILYHENIRPRSRRTLGQTFRGRSGCIITMCATTATEKGQTACKPGSVRPKMERDDHSSGTHLAMRLTRPTRAAGRKHPRNYHDHCNRNIAAAPIRSCSRWGLPCRPCCQERGALLPHRFALARGVGPLTQAGLARAVCFLWHFP
jgi:hypothetical protein